MKLFLGYWLIGCAIYGLVLAGMMKKCPNDRHEATIGDAVIVALWPSAIVGALALPSGHTFPKRKCTAVHD